MKWSDVVAVVTAMPPHRDLALIKASLPHPSKCGFVRRRIFSEPRGQKADWELVLPDGRSVHVREYKDYYLVHWDRFSPSVSKLKHLVYDAPHWLVPIVSTIAIVAALLLGLTAKAGAAGGLLAMAPLLSVLRSS